MHAGRPQTNSVPATTVVVDSVSALPFAALVAADIALAFGPCVRLADTGPGRLSPLVIGIALLIQPVVDGTVGWIVHGERLGVPDLIGVALVAAALMLVRRGRWLRQRLRRPMWRRHDRPYA